MVQMAVFPITGMGGFQFSCRNIQALTSNNYLVACMRSSIVWHVHTKKKQINKYKWTDTQTEKKVTQTLFIFMNFHSTRNNITLLLLYQ